LGQHLPGREGIDYALTDGAFGIGYAVPVSHARVLRQSVKTVVIRKVKRPEGMGRWPTYVVSEDQHGLWLFSPKGTIYRGQSGANIGECEVGQGDAEAGLPVMHLIPKEAWWTAVWCRAHDSVISVDICTPPTLIDGEFTYIDLELDPVARSDGRVDIVDEDEFVAACEAGFISHDEAIKARTAATEVGQSMRSHTEPFGRLGWDKLDEALSLSLPPITELRHVSTT